MAHGTLYVTCDASEWFTWDQSGLRGLNSEIVVFFRLGRSHLRKYKCFSDRIDRSRTARAGERGTMPPPRHIYIYIYTYTYIYISVKAGMER